MFLAVRFGAGDAISDPAQVELGRGNRSGIHHGDTEGSQAVRARSLAPLVKARGLRDDAGLK